MSKKSRWILSGVLVALVILYLAVYYYYDNMEHIDNNIEFQVFSSNTIESGTDGIVNVLVRNFKNLTKIPDADVTLKLTNPETKQGLITLKGKTNGNGLCYFRFKVPEIPGDRDLSCDMTVFVRSSIGNNEVNSNIRIKKEYRIFLSTDKDIYQPSQTIHIRALLFQAGKPAKDKPVTISVSEPGGYSVFKQELNTDLYGIRATDFTLGNKIKTGKYIVSAKIGNATESLALHVKNYSLPKFKVGCFLNKGWVVPGDVVEGRVKATYVFGKAVVSGQVNVEAEVLAQDSSTTHFNGTTDAFGYYTFQYRPLLTEPFKTKNLTIRVSVIDKAGNLEKSAVTVPISLQPIQIQVIPESKSIKQNMENIIYIITTYPDGSPACCDVSINGTIQIRTDSMGIGEYRFLTKQDENCHLEISAIDRQGNRGEGENLFYIAHKWDSLRLRTDKSIYNTGENMHLSIFSTDQKQKDVYVNVINEKQNVFSTVVRLSHGKASIDIPLEDNMVGLCTIVGEINLGNVTYIPWYLYNDFYTTEKKNVLVQHGKEKHLQLSIKPGQSSYTPGADAIIHISTGGQDGGCPAAVGIRVVDESVELLAPIANSFTPFYNQVDPDFLKVKINWPAGTFRNFLTEGNQAQQLAPAEKIKMGNILLASQKESFDSDYYYSRWGGDSLTRIGFIKKDFFDIHLLVMMVFPILMIGFLLYQYRRSLWILGLHILLTCGVIYLCIAVNAVIMFYSPDALALEILIGGLLWLIGIIAILLTYWVIIRGLPKVWKAIKPGFLFALLFTFILASSFSFLFRIERLPLIFLILCFGADVVAFIITIFYAVKEKEKNLCGVLVLYFLSMFFFFLTLRFSRSVFEEKNSKLPLYLILIVLISLGITTIRYIRAKRLISLPIVFVFLTFWLPPVFFQISNWVNIEWDTIVYMDISNYRNLANLNNEYYSQGVGGFGATGLGYSEEFSSFQNRRPRIMYAVNTEVDASKSTPIHIRQFFPETLYSNPRVITDEKGEATLAIKMADSITRWHLSALAHTLTGAMGSAEHSLPVFQDFFVEINTPQRVTVGDEIIVPAAVYNYLDSSQSVTLSMQKEEWFDVLEQEKTLSTVLVKSKDVRVVHFKIRAKTAGNHGVTIFARGRTVQDAIARDIKVTPAEKRIQHSFTAGLKKEMNTTISFPSEAKADNRGLAVRIYPGAFSQVVEGLESLLHMPYGCFEQNASTTYPSVLALLYMKKSGQVDVVIEKKAKLYISQGYQRLLTFETTPGGYSLYGKGEASTMLTAYGLMLLSDMAKVYPIDGTIISNMKKFLFSRLKKDHWATDSGNGNIFAYSNSDFSTTAYVAWSLLQAGVEKKDVRLNKVLLYLEKNYTSYQNDPALLSLYSLSLSESGENPRPILERLDKLAKESTYGMYWDNNTKNISQNTFLDSYTAIKTTALSAMAHGKAGIILNGALEMLIKSKNAEGNWYSTQSTILVLKALVECIPKNWKPPVGKVTVWIDNKPVDNWNLTSSSYKTLHQMDFAPSDSTGDVPIKITLDGRGELFCQVISTFYVDWFSNLNDMKSTTSSPLQMELTCQNWQLKKGETLSIDVSARYSGGKYMYNGIMELGIPPCFGIKQEDFEKLVAQNKINRFEVDSNRIVLYLSSLDSKVIHFRYRLESLSSCKVQMPASKIYDYYNPRLIVEVAPITVTVIQ